MALHVKEPWRVGPTLGPGGGQHEVGWLSPWRTADDDQPLGFERGETDANLLLLLACKAGAEFRIAGGEEALAPLRVRTEPAEDPLLKPYEVCCRHTSLSSGARPLSDTQPCPSVLEKQRCGRAWLAHLPPSNCNITRPWLP